MRVFGILACLAALGCPFPAISGEGLASPWVDFREARVRIIAEKPAAASLRAGIEIRLADGYKTYWRSPGESGAPPIFDFSKSAGLADPSVAFPFPTIFDDGAGGKAWGYKHAIVLPIRAKTTSPHPVLTLGLDFAVCGTMCIPLSGELVLDTRRAERIAFQDLELLTRAESRIPGPPDGQTHIRRLSAGKWHVNVPLPLRGDYGAVRAFPEAQGFLDVTAIEPQGDGRLAIMLKGEPPPGASGKFGMLRLTYGHSSAAYEAEFDLDAAPTAP